MAEERQKIYWDRESYKLVHHAAFAGVKRPRKKDFNPLEGPKGTNMAEWREFSKDAKEQLPDQMSEKEKQKKMKEKLGIGD